ncbi:MAG: hypothetical protein Q8Q73_10040 [Stagnimonas sp.]|nr:hypothetical protein [Stagnimonas sp.]
MISRKNVFAIAAVAIAVSGTAFAQVSNDGSSGSAGFQIGGLTTTNNLSSSSMASLTGIGGILSVGASGAAAISALGGDYAGPGIYVISDASGNTITVVIGGDGLIKSVEDGDTTKR